MLVDGFSHLRTARLLSVAMLSSYAKLASYLEYIHKNGIGLLIKLSARWQISVFPKISNYSIKEFTNIYVEKPIKPLFPRNFSLVC